MKKISIIILTIVICISFLLPVGAEEIIPNASYCLIPYNAAEINTYVCYPVFQLDLDLPFYSIGLYQVYGDNLENVIFGNYIYDTYKFKIVKDDVLNITFSVSIYDYNIGDYSDFETVYTGYGQDIQIVTTDGTSLTFYAIYDDGSIETTFTIGYSLTLDSVNMIADPYYLYVINIPDEPDESTSDIITEPVIPLPTLPDYSMPDNVVGGIYDNFENLFGGLAQATTDGFNSLIVANGALTVIGIMISAVIGILLVILIYKLLIERLKK